MTDAIGPISDEIFCHVFNKFDKDDSGSIGKEEMVDFVKMINEETGQPSPTQVKEKEKIQDLLSSNLKNMFQKDPQLLKPTKFARRTGISKETGNLKKGDIKKMFEQKLLETSE